MRLQNHSLQPPRRHLLSIRRKCFALGLSTLPRPHRHDDNLRAPLPILRFLLAQQNQKICHTKVPKRRFSCVLAEESKVSLVPPIVCSLVREFVREVDPRPVIRNPDTIPQARTLQKVRAIRSALL